MESSKSLLEKGQNLEAHCKTPSRTPNSIILAVWTLGLTNLLLLSGIFWTWRHSTSPAAGCTRPTDEIFGELPWHDTIFDREERFISTDPGRSLHGPTTNVTHSPWQEIYSSPWIAVSGNTTVTLPSGVDLTVHGSKTETWEPGDTAFGVSVMHQLHCLSIMKTNLIQLRDGVLDNFDKYYNHSTHCIEYIRQAAMCSADLTLEAAEDPDTYPHTVQPWGNVHRCRKWDQVIAALEKRFLFRGSDGFIRKSGDSVCYLPDGVRNAVCIP